MPIVTLQYRWCALDNAHDYHIGAIDPSMGSHWLFWLGYYIAKEPIPLKVRLFPYPNAWASNIRLLGRWNNASAEKTAQMIMLKLRRHYHKITEPSRGIKP